MSYYPIFLELEQKDILIVGGGSVAQEKVETLLRHEASISIVSRELTEKLRKLVEDNKILHAGENFNRKHLNGVFLVFAATDDKQLNHKISKIARERGLLTNAVDQPEDCDFIVPSIVRRGDLSIAISTSGKSPALSKKIRKQLGLQFGKEYETFLMLLGHLRKAVLSLGLPQKDNSRIFSEIVNSDILKSLANDDRKAVKATLRKILPMEVRLKDILRDLEKR